MTTLTDIAQRVGVSVSAVSRVIRNPHGQTDISPARRNQILKVASELNYRPSRAARFLKKGKTGTIATLISNGITTSWNWRATTPLSLQIIQGIHSYALEQGHNMALLCPTEADFEKTIRSHILDEQTLDGLVLFGETAFLQYLEQIMATGIRCVTYCIPAGEMGIPLITVDESKALSDMVQRCHELGHQSVASIVTLNKLPREQQFADHCSALGMELKPACRRQVRDEGTVWPVMMEIIKQPDRPTLLFCSSDHLAIHAMDAMKQQGLTPGVDISIVSFDDAPYLPEDAIPLATIRTPRHEMGRIAAQMLLDESNPIPARTELQASFIHRQSLGPAPRT